MNQSKTPYVVVGIGEALFDCFADKCVLGGAPVNFAAHIQQLIAPHGGRTIVVSRCGVDKLGDQLIDEISQRGVETDFIQRDSRMPTGRVDVAVDMNGEPSYSIANDAAWDYLRYDAEIERLARQASAVCYGTLAQRSQTGRQSIYDFLSATENAVRVFDVNLRQSFYNIDIIEMSLEFATVLKANEHELQLIASLIGCQRSSTVDIAFEICDRYELDLLALTRGHRGTTLFADSQQIETSDVPASHSPDADSVGAGDACCAGVVFGLLRDWPLEQTLQLANRMGSFVASCRGATPYHSEELHSFAQRGTSPE